MYLLNSVNVSSKTDIVICLTRTHTHMHAHTVEKFLKNNSVCEAFYITKL